MYRYIVFLSVILILAYLWIKLTNIANNNIEPLNCRKSDINNPMGNVLLYADKKELEYSLCKNQDIETNLRFNIYNNSKDLFLRNNNIRPFITMPSLFHPNDLENVKNTVYYFNDKSCKLNSTNCMYNENIKYHKNYFLSDKIKTNNL